MNYLVLINQFWRLNSEHPFQSSDTTLYFYLLHTCNNLGWKNPFGHSDRHLAANVGVCVNTIRASKLRLIEAGLIEVRTPVKRSRGYDGQSEYFLKTVSNSNTVHQTVSNFDTAPDTVSDTDSDTNNKLNETKQIDINKGENKIQFLVLNKTISANYPNVSALNEQLTSAEYDSLVAEYDLKTDQIFNLLDRMENYKPLLLYSNSVFRTMRIWHKADLERRTKHPNNNKIVRLEQSSKQMLLKEGPTRGNK